MKHFINILVILILTSFAFAIGYIQAIQITNAWSLLYLPLAVLILLWGWHLSNTYS